MIEQNVARVVYKGDGKTQEFPFSFPVLDRKFIYVIISDRNGREKTLTSDYYVDMDKHVVLYPGYPKGEEPAEAERPAVLAPGEKIVIYRNTPVSQLTSLGDKWPFDVCEKALDKLTMIDQENKESISRTVRLAGATEEVEVVLPPPERDTAIGWSEDGKSVINVPVKRWQEEARAAASEAQTQASMAMTYKEESKEARSKAEQSEEKAKEYADRAVMAENKVEGYNKEADRIFNCYVETARQKLEEIDDAGETEKTNIKVAGSAQVLAVNQAGETERELLKTRGDIYAGNFKKIATGIEEAKNEVKQSEEEVKKGKDEAVRSYESANMAKEQAETAARKVDMVKSEIVAVASEVKSEKGNAQREAQAAKDWAGKAETEAGKAKTEAGRAQSEVEKAKTEADRALTHSTRADEAKERAEEKAQEAKISADEAKEVLKTAMGGVDLTQYAKKESLVGLASTEYVDGRIKHVVGTAPEALDTLGEIATVLTTNKDKIGTIIGEISTKADKGIVENALMGKANKNEVEKALSAKAELKNVYNKQETEALVANETTETLHEARRIFDNQGLSRISVTFDGKDTIINTIDNSYIKGRGLATWEELWKMEANIYTKAEADGKFQPKGKYVTEAYLRETTRQLLDEMEANYLTKAAAKMKYQERGNYLSSDEIYDSGKLKLPSGAKIGVE